ncbi:unnamed protein product [Amoebophrya sp. A120]|nr:unnamed protein product [Amoebophrya sp. A120]|eukprot:GSA120T00017165001.1
MRLSVCSSSSLVTTRAHQQLEIIGKARCSCMFLNARTSRANVNDAFIRHQPRTGPGYNIIASAKRHFYLHTTQRGNHSNQELQPKRGLALCHSPSSPGCRGSDVVGKITSTSSSACSGKSYSSTSAGSSSAATTSSSSSSVPSSVPSPSSPPAISRDATKARIPLEFVQDLGGARRAEAVQHEEGSISGGSEAAQAGRPAVAPHTDSTIVAQDCVQQQEQHDLPSLPCRLVALPECRTGVAAWLFGTAGMLMGMILIGGYTRLSGSGLSMTKWKFQGTLLPSTEELWNAEFTEYKKTPEYQKLHAGTMDLPGFKRIYFVEWFHRMWGRGTGIVFALPLVYFVAVRRALTKTMFYQLSGLFTLGASQALIGWWMVRSGFVDPKEHMPHSDNKVPRVSAYRLATHLAAALTIYGGVLWTALRVMDPRSSSLPTAPRPMKGAQLYFASKPSTSTSTILANSAARRFRALTIAQAVLVATTVISGAFVAGNDAGLEYNTWPKMLDHWVPPEVTDGYKTALQTFSPSVLLEQSACVQFNHRLLAYTSAAGAFALAWKGRSVLAAKTAGGAATVVGIRLNTARFWAVYALPAAVTGQILLGITTLLNCVPIELGVAHQAGGVTVLSVLLTLLSKL